MHKISNEELSDQLTMLPDRKYLLRKIAQKTNFTKQNINYIFAILLLDLEQFQVVDSNLAYGIEDQLIIALARRLETYTRHKDIVVHLGSGEFAILLDNIKDVSHIQQIADRIYKELVLPFYIKGREVFVNVCIGIAMSKEDYQQPEEMLRDADIAMHYAKKLSRSSYQIFNLAMHDGTVEVLKLENDLRRAIERREFRLYYQPIVLLETRQIVGFEALIRWQHPQRGLIYPSEFISLAEDTGLIISLGYWVLREACYQMRAWQLKFPNASLETISVNISGKQLLKTDLLDQVKQVLQETQLEPCCLKLEITESSLIRNINTAVNVIEELKALNIQFSMDDFGTGYSSLSYLYNFPINTLKLDRSFIQKMNESRQKLEIVKAIVNLALNLDMEVVAEGIETTHQYAQLKVLKCTYGQGFLFSKALECQGLEAFMESELLVRNHHKKTKFQRNLEEQFSREQLLIHIERLKQELEELKQEKTDLEILLETTNEHSDVVELELHREISDRLKAEVALQEVNRRLQNLSCVDSLTQIANRRQFDQAIAQEWWRMAREKQPLTLIFCDVDYFKSYNDHYGHQAGDRCLKQVAQIISATLERPGDLVARYGGEEFAVILPNTEAEGAIKVAQKIQMQLRNSQLVHAGSVISDYVTMSLGIASTIPTSDSEPVALMAKADKALYQAKTQGRDRFVLADVTY
ncbi:diguanylate cyclase [Gloeocapsopsis sp. IPPAS B-1203]|uniref:diguanylate cyclase domain-containing protein n=1 Tax=Gloeocapsopsis sp. IPPAS B-1203 TaxID=2049454 RepID=UPI0025A0D71B|nr:diguanylate cyclase [Gloeocapsopsis sp. IPPAS B-1203]